MKNLIFSILFLTALSFFTSCEKQPLPDVTFTLNVSGFNLTTTEFGGLKSLSSLSDFNHHYGPGVLSFSLQEGDDYISWLFETGNQPINNFSITLPASVYTLSGSSVNETSLGNPNMNMLIPEQTITIDGSTEIVSINITPNCSLVLINDEFDLIYQSIIFDGTNQYKLVKVDKIWYAYMNSGPQFILYKKDGNNLVINTSSFKNGYVYTVEVTDTGKDLTLGFDDEFEEGSGIIW